MMPSPAEAPPRDVHEQSELKVRSPEPWALMPVEVARQQLAGAILTHDVVVLRGGTGSGKSTGGPPIFLEALQKANPSKRIKIMVGEPRQMLAEDISKRVAEISNAPWGGDLVGFYHGDDQKYSKERTQIVYTVNGSLKKRIEENLEGDPALEEYEILALDEIHLRERDQEVILIGFKEVQKKRKIKGLAPQKFIIMSAGAEQKHADYYDNSILVEVAGQEPKYNVKKVFSTSTIDPQKLPLEVARLAAEVIQDRTHYGDIVSYLPGRAEIIIAKIEFDRIMREKGLAGTYKSASLTGGGGQDNKAIQAKLGDNDSNRDPIAAFATSVAEAGATFPRLTKVIDSGQARMMVYDEQSGLERLETRGHSLNDYTQRLGRLGRVGDGEFYGMYPESDLQDESKHPKEAPPSILVEDIVPLILSLKTMGIIDVHNIDYIDHPGKEKLDKAVQTLTLLGALNSDGTLTQDGKDMEKLPYDPHFARMLVEAKKRGCVEAVSTLIGFLNNRRSVFAYDPRREHFEQKYAQYIQPGSDYLTLLKVWNAYINNFKDQDSNAFSPSVLQDVEKTKNEILQDDFFKEAFGGGLGNLEIDIEAKAEGIIACVIAGFRDRLLKRSGNGYDMVYGAKKGILPDRSSVFAKIPADMLISGLIYTPQNGSVAYAGMNQEVTQEFIKEVAPYLETIRIEKERLEKEEKKVAQTAKNLQEEVVKAGSSTHAEDNQTQEAIEKKLSFIGKLKQALNNILATIKKFLHIK